MKLRNIVLMAGCALLVACGGGSSQPPQKYISPVEHPVQPQQYTFNTYGQLIADTSKQEVACPPQTASTMVAFTFGQSNSANSSTYKTTTINPKIVNYYNGKCYAAADPLLGATGTGGSQWIAMANKIADRYDAIVLIADGVGGTSITRWIGDLNPQLATAMDQAKSQYTVTHFLWHQGEADAHRLSGTEYATDLTQIIDQTRQVFPASKFYASVATYCLASSPVDPVIQSAQQSVVNPSANIFQGVNTDQWIGASYRFDDCHLNAAGIELASSAWAGLL